jgi:Na+-transporting methylmalonyl-CoA/oxaloacetate decarboxylase gamma subunit
MLLASATGWIVGWVLGVVVVLIAALLLLAVIGFGRRIVGQAEDITRALDEAREHTAPMFDLARANLAIDRLTRGLARMREGGSR